MQRLKKWFLQQLNFWWFKMRLRGNEFHPSLNFNAQRWLNSSPTQRIIDDQNLAARRSKAHKIDLLLEDRKRK